MKHYGLGTAILDIVLTCMTGGLWFFYRIYKYMSTH